jgi:hypothetical protein
MNFEKYLIQNLSELGKDQFIIDWCITKLRSNDIENICGKTIDDIMRRGFLDYIISKQEVIDDDSFIIDIDFEFASKILVFASFYANSIDYTIDVLISQKYFYENLQNFELNYEIDCCVCKKHKRIIFNNVKVKDSEDFIWKGVHNALFAH